MEVSPEKQNINKLFSATNYNIDFYQREYKWKVEEVKTLIDDIFHHFERSYASRLDLEPSEPNITKCYSWYYLNTYITNKDQGSGRIFADISSLGLRFILRMV